MTQHEMYYCCETNINADVALNLGDSIRL